MHLIGCLHNSQFPLPWYSPTPVLTVHMFIWQVSMLWLYGKITETMEGRKTERWRQMQVGWFCFIRGLNMKYTNLGTICRPIFHPVFWGEWIYKKRKKQSEHRVQDKQRGPVIVCSYQLSQAILEAQRSPWSWDKCMSEWYALKFHYCCLT